MRGHLDKDPIPPHASNAKHGHDQSSPDNTIIDGLGDFSTNTLSPIQQAATLIGEASQMVADDIEGLSEHAKKLGGMFAKLHLDAPKVEGAIKGLDWLNKGINIVEAGIAFEHHDGHKMAQVGGQYVASTVLMDYGVKAGKMIAKQIAQKGAQIGAEAIASGEAVVAETAVVAGEEIVVAETAAVVAEGAIATGTALAAAGEGALLGGELGTVVPGLGNLVGVVVGGAVGFGVYYFTQSTWAKAADHLIGDALDATVKETWKEIDKTVETAKVIGHEIAHEAEVIDKKIHQGVEAVRNELHHEAHVVNAAIHHTVEVVDKKLHELNQELHHDMKVISDHIPKVIKDMVSPEVKEVIHEGAHIAKEAIKQEVKTIENGVKKVGDFFEHLFDSGHSDHKVAQPPHPAPAPVHHDAPKQITDASHTNPDHDKMKNLLAAHSFQGPQSGKMQVQDHSHPDVHAQHVGAHQQKAAGLQA